MNTNRKTIPIQNLHDSNDAHIITQYFNKHFATYWVDITIADKEVYINAATPSAVIDKILQALEKLGYPTTLKHTLIPVTEMTCASCAASVQNVINKQKGVLTATVNYANTEANIWYNDALTNLDTLASQVAKFGFGLTISTQSPTEPKSDLFSLAYKTYISILLGIPLFILNMFMMHWAHTAWISFLLTAIMIGYSGLHFFTNAYKKIRFGIVNMDTLVALSTGIAFLYSTYNLFANNYAYDHHAPLYFESAGIVIMFVLIGKLLESNAKQSTKAALEQLIGLQPQYVNILIGNEIQQKHINDIKKKDIIICKPGEKIAFDGIVISGTSYVDESALNGEPLPQLRQTDDQVYAGTINQDSILQYKAVKTGSETILGQIITQVKTAQSSKAAIQYKVDKVAQYFVPSVLIIALLTFIYWSVIAPNGSVNLAIHTAITVLVIACPCALGLATPTALMAAMGKAATYGILIKDANALERLKKIDTIVLDKTGTITNGQPTVIFDQAMTEQDYTTAIFQIEMLSNHPLAKAIVQHLKHQISEEHLAIDQLQDIAGKGLQCIIADQQYYVGSKYYAAEILGNHWHYSTPESYKQASAVFFFSNEKLLHIFYLIDELKPNIKTTLEQLASQNIDLIIASGDQHDAVAAVAQAVNITHYYGAQSPLDKKALISKLQNQHKVVAMIGDGINDAVALAQADVSIAMSNGSDIAVQSSDMTLLHGDIQKVSIAMRLSQKTNQIIWQNLFWAFIYNIICIPIAAGILFHTYGILMNPMWAGAAMALSSICVVTNSLRLKYIKL